MCDCGKGGKMRRGMCGACYARWLRSIVPANMSRHLAARHLGSAL